MSSRSRSSKVTGRGFAEPFVPRVRTERRLVYLKHGATAKTDGSYALEAWAYRACSELGVRVPEVIAAAVPGDDLDFIATLKLPGTSPGSGRDSSWRQVLNRAHAEKVPYLVDCGALTATEADEIASRLADASEHIPADGPRRLLHGDLEGDHIFAAHNRFSGFIDFGAMQGGDPLYDLARFAWWDAPLLAGLVDGYGRDRITDEDLAVRMPSYLIARATMVVDEVRASVRSPQQAGDFVRTPCSVRFDRAQGRVVARAPDPQSPYEVLAGAVLGKSDADIDAFSASMGGYRALCEMVVEALTAALDPRRERDLGLALGDGLEWVVRTAAGQTKVTERVARRASVTVRAQPPDFLRWITRDLLWHDAVADGRITVEGDASLLESALGGLVVSPVWRATDPSVLLSTSDVEELLGVGVEEGPTVPEPTSLAGLDARRSRLVTARSEVLVSVLGSTVTSELFDAVGVAAHARRIEGLGERAVCSPRNALIRVSTGGVCVVLQLRRRTDAPPEVVPDRPYEERTEVLVALAARAVARVDASSEGVRR